MSTTTTLDWRTYAQSKGVTLLQAWLACQRNIGSYPSGIKVTSPQSLDKVCEDPAMHSVVRAVIDDAAT